LQHKHILYACRHEVFLGKRVFANARQGLASLLSGAAGESSRWQQKTAWWR